MATVIFDLDGTLADTSGDLLAAANACFAAMDIAPPLSAGPDDGIAVRGGRAMLAAGLERVHGVADPQEVDRLYPLLLQHYERDIDRETYLYPGATDAVKALRAQGVKCGICTNKPEYLAELLIGRLGVRDLFDSLIGADTLPVRKPDPEPMHEAVRRAGGDPARAILIGDTVTDRETARAAGVASVLVTFGPAGQAVRALEPEYLLHHFDDLPALALRLLVD